METQAEDDQAFLTRQQQLLQAGVPAGVRQESPMRAPAPSVHKPMDRRSVGTPGVQAQLGSPKKVTHAPDIFAPLHFHLIYCLVLGSPPLKLLVCRCGSICAIVFICL